MLLKNYLKLRINSPMHCSVYNPLINYAWSSTYQAQEYKTDGVELVVNGDFSDGLTSWNVTNEGGTTTVTDSIVHIVSDGTSISLNQTNILEADESYYGSITVDVISGAGLRFRVGGTYIDIINSGTYYIPSDATESYINIYRRNTAPTEFTISNISVQKVIQEPNTMYSKNSGTGTDLQLYSGQGVKFNGVDQGLNVGHIVKADLGTVCFTVENYLGSDTQYIFSNWGDNRLYVYRDGLSSGFYKLGLGGSGGIGTIIPKEEEGSFVLSWDNGVWTLNVDNGRLIDNGTYLGTIIDEPNTNMFIGINRGISNYYNGTLKDLFIFNRALTQTEITKYSTNPNGFFNDALVDNTCVLNMPLAEHSDYCIDYANYSEGVVINPNSNFDSGVGQSSGWTTNSAELFKDGYVHWYQTVKPYTNIFITDLGGQGVYSLITIDAEVLSDEVRVTLYNDSGATIPLYGSYPIDTTKVYTLVVKDVNKMYIEMGKGEINTVDVKLNSVTVQHLAGVHQIQNYTGSCRDGAKQLPYGSQNANYKINNLGMRTEESPYFEGNGNYYCKSGINTEAIGQIFSFDIIIDRPSIAKNRYLIRGQDGVSGIQLDTSRTWDSSGVRLYLFNSSGNNACTIFNVSNEPTHIVFTYDGTTLKGYKNGVFYAQIAIAFDSNSNDIFRKENGENFEGTLRLFKVHQKALTQEEVTKAYTDAVNKGLLS